MRVAILFVALALTSAPAAAQQKAGESTACPKTGLHVADQTESVRGKRAEPRKLNRLPNATGYMAVHRKIGGCEAPLTMVEYRRAPKR